VFGQSPGMISTETKSGCGQHHSARQAKVQQVVAWRWRLNIQAASLVGKNSTCGVSKEGVSGNGKEWTLSSVDPSPAWTSKHMDRDRKSKDTIVLNMEFMKHPRVRDSHWHQSSQATGRDQRGHVSRADRRWTLEGCLVVGSGRFSKPHFRRERRSGLYCGNGHI
jgi:hypothetical protein